MNVTTASPSTTTESPLTTMPSPTPPGSMTYLEIGLGLGVLLSILVFIVLIGLVLYLKRRNYFPMRSSESPTETVQRSQTESNAEQNIIEVGGISALSQNDIFGFSPENDHILSANLGPSIMVNVPLNEELIESSLENASFAAMNSESEIENSILAAENPIFPKVKKKGNRFYKLLNLNKNQ
jgi:hypothetical protein